MISYFWGKEQQPWYQITCNWSSSLVTADFFSMKSQTISNSSFAPDSKPRESWKIKLLPSYVISCSISCSPLWHFNLISEHWMCTPLTCLNWWYQMGFTRFHLCTWLEQNVRNGIGLSFNLPSLSCIMMGFVPFATPQTFSRIVVLPALALPMTRMRKWGHLYWSLSSLTWAARDQSISCSGRETILTRQMQLH